MDKICFSSVVLGNWLVFIGGKNSSRNNTLASVTFSSVLLSIYLDKSEYKKCIHFRCNTLIWQTARNTHWNRWIKLVPSSQRWHIRLLISTPLVVVWVHQQKFIYLQWKGNPIPITSLLIDWKKSVNIDFNQVEQNYRGLGGHRSIVDGCSLASSFCHRWQHLCDRWTHNWKWNI